MKKFIIPLFLCLIIFVSFIGSSVSANEGDVGKPHNNPEINDEK